MTHCNCKKDETCTACARGQRQSGLHVSWGSKPVAGLGPKCPCRDPHPGTRLGLLPGSPAGCLSWKAGTRSRVERPWSSPWLLFRPDPHPAGAREPAERSCGSLSRRNARGIPGQAAKLRRRSPPPPRPRTSSLLGAAPRRAQSSARPVPSRPQPVELCSLGPLHRSSLPRALPAASAARSLRPSLRLGGRRAGAWRRPMPARRRPALLLRRRPLLPGLSRRPGPPPLRAGCWRCSGPSSAPGESAATAPPPRPGLHMEPGSAGLPAPAAGAAGGGPCRGPGSPSSPSPPPPRSAGGREGRGRRSLCPRPIRR